MNWWDGTKDWTGYGPDTSSVRLAPDRHGPAGRNRLISVVMGARDQAERQSATVTLLDYGFQRFVPVTLAAEGVGELQIRTGQPERVPVAWGNRCASWCPGARPGT